VVKCQKVFPAIQIPAENARHPGDGANTGAMAATRGGSLGEGLPGGVTGPKTPPRWIFALIPMV